MEQNEVKEYPLYKKLKKRAEERQRQDHEIDLLTLRSSLCNLNARSVKIVYWLILHHFLITSDINPERLRGVKISFYKQRQLMSGRGVQFGEIDDMTLIEILNEYVNGDD